MKEKIKSYAIQQWLFSEAEGKFEIDLAESGIQFHYFHDLKSKINYDLNYSLDKGKYKLRELIATMYNKPIEEVTITHGAQEGLYLFYQTYLRKGDHVITFSPGWQQSWEVPISIGAEVSTIVLSAKTNYQVDVQNLYENIKENTKLIILNNPNNPTGAMLSKQCMKNIIELCEKYNIFLLCDEEYFVDYKNSIVNQYEYSACVSSLSKVYGFPGLRVGWFIGPEKIVEDVVNYKRYVTVSNSSLCEYFAMEVIENYKNFIMEYKNTVAEGYEIIKAWIENHESLSLIEPEGTPFCYIALKNGLNSDQLSKRILREQRVLVMPAEVFQDTNALRVSFGRPSHILNEGLQKISKVLDKL